MQKAAAIEHRNIFQDILLGLVAGKVVFSVGGLAEY
jgi:hypothetical protein